MIKLSGTLTVRMKTGRKGDFVIGELLTEIGKFKVKDAILDQFEEGVYKGQFVVSQIYGSSYSYPGGVVAEIRATLANIFLDSQVDTVPQLPDAEPDPADESTLAPKPEPRDQPAAQPSAQPFSKPQAAKSLAPAPSEPSAPQGDEELFGELFADVQEKNPVRLDPTIDRVAFRAQRDRLKALGYKFDATNQTWEVQTGQ